MEIRKASLKDLDEIVALERATWKEEAASVNSLRRRIESFPEGFVVVYIDYQLAGMANSARLSSEHKLTDNYYESFDPWERIHNTDGTILFLYSSAVNPNFRERGVWRAMVDFRLDCARENPQIQRAWAVGRKQSNRYGFAMVPLFEKLGFKTVREFSDNSGGTVLMELLPPYALIRGL